MADSPDRSTLEWAAGITDDPYPRFLESEAAKVVPKASPNPDQADKLDSLPSGAEVFGEGIVFDCRKLGHQIPERQAGPHGLGAVLYGGPVLPRVGAPPAV